MKHIAVFFLFVFFTLTGRSVTAVAGVPSKVTREILKETLDYAAKQSGREMGSRVALDAATETLERLTRTYGDDVLKAVRDGGVELIEAVSKYGDDVIEVAIASSPAARRALARDVPRLLPLATRVGVEVLELEAKTPGLAVDVFATFGDDAGIIVAKHVPTEDVPRLLAYGEKADTPATRELLLESYQKEGRKLFDRVPAKLVLATGLSASMLYGTHRLTEPAVATGDAIRDNGDVAATAIRHFIMWGCACVFALGVLIFWRFRLMPWHGRRKASVVGDSQEDDPFEQPPPR